MFGKMFLLFLGATVLGLCVGAFWNAHTRQNMPALFGAKVVIEPAVHHD